VRDVSQGDLKLTGNTLDAALEGTGYYSVSTTAGVRYTRNGSFQLTTQGQLVTAQGNPVLDDRGNPLTIPQPPGRIVIAEDGTVTNNDLAVGKLGVVKFDNQQQLVEESTGLYTASATPTPDAETRVHQGVVEGSNVKSVIEMTRMLSVQGAYSDVVQVLSSEDTRLKNAIDKLSRVA
jgi:flagellar basal-body rod protein FlgF